MHNEYTRARFSITLTVVLDCRDRAVLRDCLNVLAEHAGAEEEYQENAAEPDDTTEDRMHVYQQLFKALDCPIIKRLEDV